MSVGGATWDDAGTLTLDADNTFLLAAAGADEPPFYDLGWWTFTPTQDGVLTLIPNGEFEPRLYIGTDGDRERLDRDSFVGDFGVTFTVSAGTEYRVLATHFAFDTPPPGDVYQITASFQRFRTTDWLTTLRDRDDNVLIIGREALLALNPWPEWETPQVWYDTLMAGDEPAPGRLARYRIQSVISGTSLLVGADDCSWAHAVNGDQSSPITLWNTSTDDADEHGDPTCRALGEGDVGNGVVDLMRYELSYSPPAGLVAGSMTAEIDIRAFSPAFRHLLFHLTQRGALSLDIIDAIADGLTPAQAAIANFEFQPGFSLELLSVEFTVDTNGEDVDPDAQATIVVNPTEPTYSAGWGSWTKGVLAGGDETFVHEDGVAWHTLPIDDFADLADEGADAVIVAALTDALISTLPATWNDDFVQRFNASSIGYRFTFRSPAYRWTWLETATGPQGIPPRRIFQRSDAMTHGARRVIGGGNTRQHGTRVFGHIL